MKRKYIGLTSILLIVLLVFTACGAGTWDEHYELGMKYLSDGNYEEAVIEFEAAIELDETKADAYLRLAEVYIEQGDLQKAIEILEEGYEKTKSTSLLDKLKDANRNNLNDEEWNLLKTVYDSMKTEEYEEVCALNEGQNVSALLIKLQGQCFDGKDIVKYISGSAIKSIVLPTGEVGIYYGNLEDGKASGNGCCLSGQMAVTSRGKLDYCLYTGGWQENLPNGKGKFVTISSGSNGSDAFTRTVSGLFSNDKYDGEMQEVLVENDSDYTWEYCCKDGKIILDERWEKEGNIYAIYPSNKDGSLGRRIYQQDDVYAVYSFEYH